MEPIHIISALITGASLSGALIILAGSVFLAKLIKRNKKPNLEQHLEKHSNREAAAKIDKDLQAAREDFIRDERHKFLDWQKSGRLGQIPAETEAKSVLVPAPNQEQQKVPILEYSEQTIGAAAGVVPEKKLEKEERPVEQRKSSESEGSSPVDLTRFAEPETTVIPVKEEEHKIPPLVSEDVKAEDLKSESMVDSVGPAVSSKELPLIPDEITANLLLTESRSDSEYENSTIASATTPPLVSEDAERVQPAETVQVAQPEEPVKSVQVTEPAEFVEPSKTFQPVQLTEPLESGEPSKTFQPVQVTEPVESAEPPKIVQPVQENMQRTPPVIVSHSLEPEVKTTPKEAEVAPTVERSGKVEKKTFSPEARAEEQPKTNEISPVIRSPTPLRVQLGSAGADVQNQEEQMTVEVSSADEKRSLLRMVTFSPVKLQVETDDVEEPQVVVKISKQMTSKQRLPKVGVVEPTRDGSSSSRDTCSCSSATTRTSSSTSTQTGSSSSTRTNSSRSTRTTPSRAYTESLSPSKRDVRTSVDGSSCHSSCSVCSTTRSVGCVKQRPELPIVSLASATVPLEGSEKKSSVEVRAVNEALQGGLKAPVSVEKLIEADAVSRGSTSSSSLATDEQLEETVSKTHVGFAHMDKAPEAQPKTHLPHSGPSNFRDIMLKAKSLDFILPSSKQRKHEVAMPLPLSKPKMVSMKVEKADDDGYEVVKLSSLSLDNQPPLRSNPVTSAEVPYNGPIEHLTPYSWVDVRYEGIDSTEQPIIAHLASMVLPESRSEEKSRGSLRIGRRPQLIAVQSTTVPYRNLVERKKRAKEKSPRRKSAQLAEDAPAPAREDLVVDSSPQRIAVQSASVPHTDAVKEKSPRRKSAQLAEDVPAPAREDLVVDSSPQRIAVQSTTVPHIDAVKEKSPRRKSAQLAEDAAAPAREDLVVDSSPQRIAVQSATVPYRGVVKRKKHVKEKSPPRKPAQLAEDAAAPAREDLVVDSSPQRIAVQSATVPHTDAVKEKSPRRKSAQLAEDAPAPARENLVVDSSPQRIAVQSTTVPYRGVVKRKKHVKEKSPPRKPAQLAEDAAAPAGEDLDVDASLDFDQRPVPIYSAVTDAEVPYLGRVEQATVDGWCDVEKESEPKPPVADATPPGKSIENQSDKRPQLARSPLDLDQRPVPQRSPVTDAEVPYNGPVEMVTSKGWRDVEKELELTSPVAKSPPAVKSTDEKPGAQPPIVLKSFVGALRNSSVKVRKPDEVAKPQSEVLEQNTNKPSLQTQDLSSSRPTSTDIIMKSEAFTGGRSPKRELGAVDTSQKKPASAQLEMLRQPPETPEVDSSELKKDDESDINFNALRGSHSSEAVPSKDGFIVSKWVRDYDEDVDSLDLEERPTPQGGAVSPAEIPYDGIVEQITPAGWIQTDSVDSSISSGSLALTAVPKLEQQFREVQPHRNIEFLEQLTKKGWNPIFY